MKYGEQYRFVFGCLLALKVWVDEDKSPSQTLQLQAFVQKQMKVFNVTVLIVIEF